MVASVMVSEAMTRKTEGSASMAPSRAWNSPYAISAVSMTLLMKAESSLMAVGGIALMMTAV